MNDVSLICYKRNFLHQVIVRMDFLQFVSTEIIMDSELERTIIKYFQRKEKEQLLQLNSINLTLQNTSLVNSNGMTTEGVQREYSSEGNNKFFLSNQYMIFEINKYNSFEEHMKGIRDIVQEICRKTKMPIQRTGIRYINIFDSNGIKFQKNFFSNEIASFYPLKGDASDDNLIIVRSMHTNEYRYNSMKIVFRHGMYNPDYPNSLKDNSFVLDYDSYTDDAIVGSEDVLASIDKGHEAIQLLFEKSITDYLRKVLNDE